MLITMSETNHNHIDFLSKWTLMYHTHYNYDYNRNTVQKLVMLSMILKRILLNNLFYLS